MNEQEQRIAIAKFLGWKNVRVFDKRKEGGHSVYNKDGDLVGDFNGRLARHLPDYLNDLNAMHDAEKVLGRNQKNRYLNILHEICLPDDYDELDDDFNWCTATAAQRAEAFLKTLNIWTE